MTHEESDRVLGLLAAKPEGLMPEEKLLRKHHVRQKMLIELVNAGLVTVQMEPLSRRRSRTWVRITEAGRKAIGAANSGHVATSHL
jgi:hypothetical protein